MIRHFLVARISFLAILVTTYYAWDWMPLCVAERNAVSALLRVVGYLPEAFLHDGSPALRLGTESYLYTAECTYIDLLLTLVPFVWLFEGTILANMRRIAIAAIIILVGNLIRSWISVYLNLRGIDWFYAHDLPDYVIWWPTVVVVVVLALRRDFGEPGQSYRGSHPGESSPRGEVRHASP
jgi:exosortase/archaeosortase family protein